MSESPFLFLCGALPAKPAVSIFTAEVSSFFFRIEKKKVERKKGKHWKQGRE